MMPSLPTSRYRRRMTAPAEHNRVTGHLAGLCQGCRAPYKPRVYEDICTDCVASIMASPDEWVDRMISSLKMFDNDA